ncbi:hypothetical protein [Chitinophaga barathri]|uniref:Uncharacterized protein n=1 Tax=Chitinophaga barathri TaxID=1647451 RepID=A0A3N4MEF4_9BACT|nr:hypothetical protein [Chitinophaga barathri]RPD41968.1 hypothetical protein EG028_07365 [Chitinophaga barathri]
MDYRIPIWLKAIAVITMIFGLVSFYGLINLDFSRSSDSLFHVSTAVTQTGATFATSVLYIICGIGGFGVVLEKKWGVLLSLCAVSLLVALEIFYLLYAMWLVYSILRKFVAPSYGWWMVPVILLNTFYVIRLLRVYQYWSTPPQEEFRQASRVSQDD